MPQPNDLSRSLVALDQNSTIIAVIEMNQSSWLVAGMLPGIERQPRKKLEPRRGGQRAFLEKDRVEQVWDPIRKTNPPPLQAAIPRARRTGLQPEHECSDVRPANVLYSCIHRVRALRRPVSNRSRTGRTRHVPALFRSLRRRHWATMPDPDRHHWEAA